MTILEWLLSSLCFNHKQTVFHEEGFKLSVENLQAADTIWLITVL